MSSFKDLRIVDNFYQTSAYYPMPTVLISTLTPDGKTSLGPYSLIAPYYVAGKEYYAMLLNCRNSSNTAQHLLANGKCAINFIPDSRKFFKEAVRMGWPGDTPEEKMKDCKFTLEDGLRAEEDPKGLYPKVVQESFQVFECTWMRELDNAQDDKPGELNGYPGPYHNFNGITSPFGAHFILRIDHILMKEKQYNGIINGVTAWDFPRVPVDYGYRDSKNFWYTKFRRPIPELLPVRQTSVQSVRYAADRIDDKIKFTDEACARLVKVPRIFLPTALKGCVQWARENGVTLITEEHMDIINDKRSKEKNK
ncbi:MAG: hypothetical protein II794_07470 [Oscillospiraceae bacterium]|nr:hypothetical protein [Oscillospiraceae bacterium]